MKLSDISKNIEDRYPDDWPPLEYFIHELNIKSDVVEGLRSIIDRNAGEREIDKYISSNPVILTSVLDLNNTWPPCGLGYSKKSYSLSCVR